MQEIDFTNKRVVDLGFGYGRYTYGSLLLGASHVWSIDKWQGYVPAITDTLTAEMGFPPDRFDLVVGSFFEQPLPSADIVLALGILYHTERHLELLQRIKAINSQYVIVETMVLPNAEIIVQDRRSWVHPATSWVTPFIPSLGCCFWLFKEAGFANVKEMPSDTQDRRIFVLS